MPAAAPTKRLKRLHGRKRMLSTGDGGLCNTCCAGACLYLATLCEGESGPAVHVPCGDVDEHPSGETGIVFAYNGVCYEVSTSHTKESEGETIVGLAEVTEYPDCETCMAGPVWADHCDEGLPGGLACENCPSSYAMSWTGINAELEDAQGDWYQVPTWVTAVYDSCQVGSDSITWGCNPDTIEIDETVEQWPDSSVDWIDMVSLHRVGCRREWIVIEGEVVGKAVWSVSQFCFKIDIWAWKERFEGEACLPPGVLPIKDATIYYGSPHGILHDPGTVVFV